MQSSIRRRSKELTGAKGKVNEKDAASKVAVPRSDLSVNAAGVRLTPRHAGNGRHIVAIHQHMTGESPRIMVVYYWGLGPTTTLAKSLTAALDLQRK